MDPIQLSIFANRLAGICDEMGALLRASALSPNIKDRLDFSCAIFDAGGGLCAQAAHIPVHLGSMAYAMADLVEGREWRPGDLLVVNDPYLGGTHLPDVTVVAPVFVDGAPRAFTVTRAHHANIGASSPGSMPVSRTLEEEGLVIAPQWLKRAGDWQLPLCRQLAGLEPDPAATGAPLDVPRFADFAAQASACQAGARRLAALIAERGPAALETALAALNDYGERRMRQRLADLADGAYHFTDWMDDDGQGQEDIAIAVTLTVDGDRAHLDFTGTADQVAGNINCPLSVARRRPGTASAACCPTTRRPAPACSGRSPWRPRRAAWSTPAGPARWPPATWKPARASSTWCSAPWRTPCRRRFRRPARAP